MQQSNAISKEDYMADASILDITHYGDGDGGGFGGTPGQRLRRVVARHNSFFQWLEDNMAASEWERTAYKLKGAWRPRDLFYAAKESRHKQSATQAEVRQLTRLVHAIHDPVNAPIRLREVLTDPAWGLLVYRDLATRAGIKLPNADDGEEI